MIQYKIAAMRWSVLFLVPLLIGGCGSSGKPADQNCKPSEYPCGPYGYSQGATIANLSLQVQQDDNQNGSATDDAVKTVTLADYFLEKDLSALVIIIGSQGCVPCQNEQPDLVKLDQMYAGKVAFLEAIVQNAQGQPATQQVIDGWVAQFMVPFDMTPDPTNALAPYYPSNSFPSAIAIRTSDMQIVYDVVGPDDGLAAALTSITN
jgi:thiol-disulfide isomerase/thioredoxin